MIFVMVMALSAASAAWVLDAARGARPGGLARRLLGRPSAAPWEVDKWACAHCRSANPATARTCQRCRAPRSGGEVALGGPVPTEPDVIPASIPVGADGVVTLEHNAQAHADGLNGHWRLRVNGVVVGSAARHDGALALLRAVDGAERVLFDANGVGHAVYSLASLIAAFESPKLPLNAPCPEHGRRRA